MSNIITVDNLQKVYSDGTEAVKGISFSVEEGDFFGFLGPNGAGKTTTIKILITLISKTSGYAKIDSIDVSKEPMAVREIIGYSAQEVGIDDELTGMENVQLQGYLYHMPKREVVSRSLELLELLDLSKDANKRTGFYSGGMRKRLDLACALIHKPKVLFLDEPTTGLDPQTRANLWQYLSHINREEGITIFLTTHYMEEADKLCRNIAIIDHGNIIDHGTPESLKEKLGGSVIQVSLPPEDQDKIPDLENRLLNMEDVKEVSRYNHSLHIYSPNGERMLPVLISEITKSTTIESISFSGPTLEDVFIKLTGHKIREEDVKPLDSFTKRRRVARRQR